MSNVAAVKRRLRDIAVHAVTTNTVDLGVTNRSAEAVPVAYGLPPDTANQTCLYFGGLTKTYGSTEPTAMRANTAVTDDDYRITGTVDAFGFSSDEDAEEAAERILNAFTAVLARCKQQLLDRTDGGPTSGGVADGSDPSAFKVQSAQLAEWSFQPFAPVGDTCVARAEFTVRCTTSNL